MEKSSHDMQPLLASEDEVGVEQSQPAAGSPRSQWIWLVVLLSYIPVVGLTVVGTWAILRSRAGPSASPQDTFPTLRQSGALKWERRLFPTEIYNNPYAGEPSPELDLAWHNLFEGKFLVPKNGNVRAKRKARQPD